MAVQNSANINGTGIIQSDGLGTFTAIAPAIDGVLISSHTNTPSWLANSGTPGYVLTANSAAPPSWQATNALSNYTQVYLLGGM